MGTFPVESLLQRWTRHLPSRELAKRKVGRTSRQSAPEPGLELNSRLRLNPLDPKPLLVQASCNKNETFKRRFSQTAQSLPCYSEFCVHTPLSKLTRSSAKQPLVQAPAQIREVALLRKISAAGAHATLSPARKRREPTPNRMEDLHEESEEENIQPNGYDAVLRQREIANQKARIVSQMTAKREHRVYQDESPRKQPVAEPSGLSPARTLPNTGRQPRAKSSLYDTVRMNLDLAFSQGSGFRTPRRLFWMAHGFTSNRRH